MSNVLSKIVLLAVYGLALLSYAMPLPLSTDAIGWLRIGAPVLLAVHLLEVVLCLRKAVLHKGPLFDNVLPTLLFGFLHWKPLADVARQACRSPQTGPTSCNGGTDLLQFQSPPD